MKRLRWACARAVRAASRERLRRAWLRAARGANRERLRWAVRIRGAVIGLFLVVALAAWATGVLASVRPALLAAAAGTLMNVAASARVRRWRRIPAMLAWTGAGDALLITYLVWATGGTESPFLFLYVVQVLTTALVVDLGMAALAGASGVALLALAALWGEPLTATLVAGPGSGPARLIWLLSLGLTLFLLVFIGGRLTRRLARSERQLAGAHRRLARSLCRLTSAHAALQEAYDRLARAEAQLVSAEKMRALGVLVAGVAHELGNPLSVLAGNLEPLADVLAGYEGALAAVAAVPLPADDARAGVARGALAAAAPLRSEAPALLANCREAMERAVTLLAQLRSFGRGTPGSTRRLVPLAAAITSTLALVRHRFPPGVRVHEAYDEVQDVLGVPAELNQVLMNLLLNAADALVPGGNLWVTLREHGGEVRITVRDDGAGIAPGALPHVFEPFFTTKEVGRGTGLGLAISHAIVARHGGRLEARNPGGGGAELTVALPRSGGGVEEGAAAAVAARTPPAAGLSAAASAPEVGRDADLEAIAHALAEQVEGENGEHDREPGKEREVGCHEDEGAGVVQHRPPGGGRRLHAEAEEAQRGLGDDGPGHAEGGLHDQRRREQRQEMPDDDTARRRAERTRRLDELALAQPVHLAADQARIAGPADQAEGEDHVPQARAEEAGERDREQEAGKGEEHVDGAHQELVDPAARVAGDSAEGAADRDRDDDGREPDRERDA